MIQAATKYGGARQQAAKPAAPRGVQTFGKAPAIFAPTLLNMPQQLQDWYWRELKGGELLEYLLREKHDTSQRMRAVKRQMLGFKQNRKSDFQLKAAVPAREFFRWQATDKDFWKDDNNLRSWKRDNEDAVVLV